MVTSEVQKVRKSCVPNEIRTRVRSLKSSGPRPLDDGDGGTINNYELRIEKAELWTEN
jgi:hypothetical protein